MDLAKYDYIETIYGDSCFDNTEKVLELLADDDECVRLEMIEACYNCEQEIIQERLFRMLELTEGLERGYVLITLSYIYQNDSEKLEGTLKSYLHSADVYERLDARLGLIILGDVSYLEDLIPFFKSEEYTIRCAVANMLAELIQNEILSKRDVVSIYDEIYQISLAEETRAAGSALQHLLEVMGNDLKEEIVH